MVGHVVLLGLLLLPPAAATAAGPPPSARVVDMVPPAGAVVGRGAVTVSARVLTEAVTDVSLAVDGIAVDVALEERDGGVGITADTSVDPGLHIVHLVAEGKPTVEHTWAFSSSPLETKRLAGATRIETAAVIAAALDDGSAPRAGLARGAVLTRADDFADALAGVGLASTVGGPLLLTAKEGLAAPTRAALLRGVRPAGTVYLMGGTAALSSDVAEEVRSLGFDVRRLAGPTRYETAVEAARAGVGMSGERGGSDEQVAVVASGEAFADGLAMSVPAAREGWPVVLTPADELSPATSAYLRSAGITRVELVGGSAAVSTTVAGSIAAFTRLRRTGGGDRFDTAALIAARFFDDSSGAALANGWVFADALSGGVLAAREDVPLLLASARLPEATAAVVGARSRENDRLLVFGGEEAVPQRAVQDAHRRADSRGGLRPRIDPAPGTVLVATPGETPEPITFTVEGAVLSNRSVGAVAVGGHEALTTTSVSGDTLELAFQELPRDLPPSVDIPVEVRATVIDDTGSRAHVDEDLVLRLRPPLVTTAEGYRAIGGAGSVVGRGGSLRTYSLEVEPGTGVDSYAFAESAEAALSDPRGWTGSGSLRLQRVEPPQADIRVVLGRPALVDRLCALAGLDTGGFYSCWNGKFAALNLDRWNTGAPGFDAPLSTYQGYLVNHEVGHGLGHGHMNCPSAGVPAPVMMQQTKGTGACMPNAWPFP